MTYPASYNTLHGTDGQIKWYPNESTFGGSLASAAGIVLEVVDDSVKETVNRIKYNAINGTKQPKRDRFGNRRVEGSLGIITNLEQLPHFFQALMGPPTEKAPLAIWEQFAGSGLDDLTAGGTFSGSQFTVIIVEIETAGATDQFKWSADGGLTWTTGVAITGAAQTLTGGITATFGATTGHTAGARWYIYAHKQRGFIFAPSSVTPPSGKLERSWSTLSPERHIVYSGQRVSRIRVTLGSEWDGKVTVEFLGRNQEDPATSPLDATPTVYTASWLAGPDLMLLRSGERTYRIEQLDITFDRGMSGHKRYPGGGGGVVSSLPVGTFMVTGTITVAMADAEYLTEARAFTNLDLGFRLVDTATAPNVMDCRLAEVTIDPTEPGLTNDDITNQFNFSAHYEESFLGSMCQVIFENGLATGAYAGPA